MKIYFAGSMTGGRDDVDLYIRIIEHLKSLGHEVLTEHVSDPAISEQGEQRPAVDIYQDDIAWLREADVVVAEVTQPSLGVGYELGFAEAAGTPVLCLFRELSGRKLSAMLSGNPNLDCRTYQDLEGVLPVIGEWLDQIAR